MEAGRSRQRGELLTALAVKVVGMGSLGLAVLVVGGGRRTRKQSRRAFRAFQQRVFLIADRCQSERDETFPDQSTVPDLCCQSLHLEHEPLYHP